jgi:predicted nucleotidyltransferase component of viral defense system
MIDDVLKARFDQYAPANATEQENMLKETMQHYILASLSKHGLFSEAIFHGGTCLRIVNGMRRFSEDLDFLLKTPDARFKWEKYLTLVQRDCAGEGIEFESVDREACDATVRKAFLKTDSVGNLLTFQLPFGRHQTRKVRVKLEIDTNPPAGSSVETAYLMFPRPEPLTTQTLESGFALKLHALLCRTYVKGRDWYDFLWYVARKTHPDLRLLANALEQQGPWAGSAPEVTHIWLTKHLVSKIDAVDWTLARDDVQRFLPHTEQDALRNWNQDMFQYQARQFSDYTA